jgi:hypothetical protein
VRFATPASRETSSLDASRSLRRRSPHFFNRLIAASTAAERVPGRGPTASGTAFVIEA